MQSIKKTLTASLAAVAIVLASLVAFTGVANAVTQEEYVPSHTFMITAWEMPAWVGLKTPTWSQDYVASLATDSPDLDQLNKYFECGSQYQIDLYRDDATTNILINYGKGGGTLDGPSDPKKESFPSQEELPRKADWGVIYKLVQSAPCVPASPKAPEVVQSTECNVEGTFAVTPVDGVSYFFDGEPTSGYTGPVSGTLTAKADEGYVLTDSEWSYQVNIPAAETCPPVTPVPPVTTPPTTVPPVTTPPTTVVPTVPPAVSHAPFTCEELGYVDIQSDDVLYHPDLDADHDGVACDSVAVPADELAFTGGFNLGIFLAGITLLGLGSLLVISGRRKTA